MIGVLLLANTAISYFNEFTANLKRGLVAPVYLFHGEEDYLRDFALNRLKESLAQDGQAELPVDVLEGDSKPADITARAEIIPFGAAKRLVVVKNPPFFKSGKRGGEDKELDEQKIPGGEAALLAYIENPSPATCLVFTTAEPVDKRKRLFKAIKKYGQEIECNRLSPGDLNRWVAKRAGEMGRRFGPGAINALLNATGPSMQLISLEIEKLVVYTKGQEVISLEDVNRLCPTRLEDNVFAVVDAIGNKRYGDALAGIKDLLAAKEPPPRLLAMIARQLRILLMACDLKEQGCPEREIPQRLQLHPFVARKVIAQSQNFNKEILLGAMTALSDLDLGIKTGKMEFYPAMETFLLSLTPKVRE